MQFGLSETVAHWGRYRRDRRAILTNGNTVSYGDLNRAVDAVLQVIAREPSSRIAVASGSKHNLIVAIIAVLRAGKSVVMLNPYLSDEALKTNMDDTEVEVILHDGFSNRLVALVEERGGRALDLTTTSNEKMDVAQVVRESADEWGVLFSSGTTGTPKGIERDHDSMVTEFLGWIIELGLRGDTTFYIGRPISYTGGLVLAAATLLVGGTILINDLVNENDPLEAWDDLCNVLHKDRIDWIFLIPDQVRRFIKNFREPKLSRWPENVLVMGGPITGDEKIALSKLLNCNVIESWGNTESLGTITEAEDLNIRPNSIGRPFVGDELVIVDDNLCELPHRERGRIAGGIEAGFVRYSNRPDTTLNVRRDGLIISEDYGYQDEDGYFYILGRLSDSVVRNGISIFLSGIEAHIRCIESVDDCCVTSVGDENEVQIVAIISTHSDIDEKAMCDKINESLSVDTHVDRVILMDIPRLPSGKLDRVSCKKIAGESYGG